MAAPAPSVGSAPSSFRSILILYHYAFAIILGWRAADVAVGDDARSSPSLGADRGAHHRRISVVLGLGHRSHLPKWRSCIGQ